MIKEGGQGRAPVKAAAWLRWAGCMAAGLVMAGCGGGTSSAPAAAGDVVAAAAADDEASGARMRAQAVAATPLIADGYLVLRNVADPTRLLAGPQPSSDNQRPQRDAVGLETPVFGVAVATDAAVPPAATLRYTALTAAEAAAQDLNAQLGCGKLTLRTPLKGGNFLTVSALHVAQSGAGALTNLPGQPMWGSRAQGTLPSPYVCAEASPGGQGLYLRWPDQPGKVLALNAQGQFLLVPDPKTAAEIARASFVAQPVPAFVANQPPSIAFDFLRCDTFTLCVEAPLSVVPKLKAGEVHTIPVTVSDAEGQLDRVELLNGDQVIATSRVAPYTLSWTPAVGFARLTVRAWDKQGAWTVSDWMAFANVEAAADVGALSATIVAPAPGATVEAGWVSLQYRTADTRGDNGISNAHLKVDERTVLKGCCAGLVTGKVWLEPGTYRLTAWREDGSGQIVSSAAQILTVVPATNAPELSILTPTLGLSLVNGRSVRLTASVSGSTGPYRVRYLQRTFANVCINQSLPDRPDQTNCLSPLDPAHPDLSVYLGRADPAQPDQSVALGTPPYGLDVVLPVARESQLYAEVTDAAGKVFRSKPMAIFVASERLAVLQAPKVTPLQQAVTLQTAFLSSSLSQRDVEFYDGNTKIGVVTVAARATAASLSWTPQTAGAHQLFARLLPAFGTSEAVFHTAVERVYVKGPDNLPPVVRISSPTAGTGRLAGVPMVVKANPGDYDGYIRRVEFYDGTTLIGTATASPWSITWAGSVGAHSLVAKAFDNAGASTLSSPVNLPLKASNVAPTVSVVTPAAGTAVQTGVPVTITTNPGDLDGFIRRVDFFDGSALIGSVTTRPWALSWTPGTTGSRLLTARATDNSEVSTTSRSVTVTVLAR